MFIESLELNNYRNYKNLSILFDEKTNLLYGDNAQGKTNILESIYVCATAKSHRGSKDKELINFENEICTITGKWTCKKPDWAFASDILEQNIASNKFSFINEFTPDTFEEELKKWRNN